MFRPSEPGSCRSLYRLSEGRLLACDLMLDFARLQVARVDAARVDAAAPPACCLDDLRPRLAAAEARRDVAAVLAELRAHHGDALATLLCCSSLEFLAQAQGWDEHTPATDALHALVRALDCSAVDHNTVDVLRTGLRAIWRCVRNRSRAAAPDEEDEQDYVLNILNFLVCAMYLHPADERVQEFGLYALCNLVAQSEANCRYACSASII
jgi:hypothetical protein